MDPETFEGLRNGLNYLDGIDDLTPDQLKALHPFVSVFGRLAKQVVKDGDPNGHGQLVVELEKLLPAQLAKLAFICDCPIHLNAAAIVARVVAAGNLEELIEEARKISPGLSF